MAQREGRLAIQAGRLVDVEAGEVRAGEALLVEGERIAAVLPAGAPLPAGVELLDLSGHTAPTPASTRTAGTPGSSPTWCATA